MGSRTGVIRDRGRFAEDPYPQPDNRPLEITDKQRLDFLEKLARSKDIPAAEFLSHGLENGERLRDLLDALIRREQSIGL